MAEPRIQTLCRNELTVFNALSVVSSREAARQPSSVDPPSHIPANAAMLLKTAVKIISDTPSFKHDKKQTKQNIWTSQNVIYKWIKISPGSS